MKKVEDLTELKKEAVQVPEKTNQISVRSLEPIKFRDRSGRSRIIIDLRQAFGFLPEVLIVDKVNGANNKIQIHAELTQEVVAELEKIRAEKQEALKLDLERMNEIGKNAS